MAARMDNDEGTNQAAEDGRNAVDEAARTVRAVAGGTADSAQHAVRAGAEVA